jgi:hypothetical protein
MRTCESRPIPGVGGYVRSGLSWSRAHGLVGRSDSAGAVLVPTVVKMKILEGKQ